MGIGLGILFVSLVFLGFVKVHEEDPSVVAFITAWIGFIIIALSYFNMK